MEAPALHCKNIKRRNQIRDYNKSLAQQKKTGKIKDKLPLNGLDYIEISDDQKTLKVVLLQKATPALREKLDSKKNPHAAQHFAITGGRRIPAIEVDEVAITLSSRKGQDDSLKITIKKPGDFSIYSLRVVEIDESGRSTGKILKGFDPRYAKLRFSFKENCPTDLDCKTPQICPPPEREQPEINYLAKDYSSFRQLILDRLSQIMPDWQERHVPDIGITLVEMLAFAGDYLSYYQDAVATEAYLDTARQRISVRRHARLVDYPMHEGSNARTWIAIETEADESFDPSEIYFITRLQRFPRDGKILNAHELEDISTKSYTVFEPLVEKPDEMLHFRKAHNTIRFYTWGDQECCLPRKATSATLRDEWKSKSKRALHLHVGDILIFEEVKGPTTEKPADANPGHRHAVRLTGVNRAVDPLNQQPVVEIEWAQKDELPFPLCISTMGPAPDCEIITDISVARGNVLLADHGRRIDREALGSVALKASKLTCVKEGQFSETVLEPKVFSAILGEAPLTYRAALESGAPASKMLKQDPAKGLGQIRLECTCILPGGEEKIETWTLKRDLLRSGRRDRHFVAETDNDGRAHLRFGDGESGQKPAVGESFEATYRVGVGPAGNIGAETISHLVLRSADTSGARLMPRNPFPAQGGVQPEPLKEVKLFAPTAFQKRLERAITPEDYADLAAKHEKVQRAAATLRWNGSWYEMLVAIDPFGTTKAEQTLLDEIDRYLRRFRRMGHDIVVKGAEFVPLDIRLEICVLPAYLRGHVKAEQLRTFSNKALPDGKRGFFHPDNLTFGQDIRLSNLITKAQAIPGVESVVATKFERLFEGANRELENGILLLGPLEIARLDNDPNFPENGRIEFIMRGGR